MKSQTLPLTHFLLALAVMAVWGTNFVVIKVALVHLPPLLFAALRFLLAAFPAVFILPRPKVKWSSLAFYGVVIGAGQFGFLYIAMNGRISPGLASLVIQTQVFFTIALSITLSGERVSGMQILALALATAGLGVIFANGGGDATALGLALTLLAALCWAGGNIVARMSAPSNMLAYVVWASLFSFPPLFALSFLFEGWPRIASGLASADAVTWAAVLYQSAGNTLFGYATWGWLLARHPTAVVSPMALLVPVFGMASSSLLLGEPLPTWKLIAAALVMSGLALNLFWPMLRVRLAGAAAGE